MHSIHKYTKKKIFIIKHLYKIDKGIEESNNIFLGYKIKATESILKKIKKKGKSGFDKLNELEVQKLVDYYGHKTVFEDQIFNNININFVYSFINEDDTINTIRKKILVHMSEPEKDKFYSINHQLLWVNKYNLLDIEKTQIRERLWKNFGNLKLSLLRTLLKDNINVKHNCENTIEMIKKDKSKSQNIIRLEEIAMREKCNMINVNKSEYNKLDFLERCSVIGFSYQNEYGIKIHKVDPYTDTENEYLNNVDPGDILVDENSHLLNSYNDIKNNIIYFIDYDTFINESDTIKPYPNKKLLWPNSVLDLSEQKLEYHQYNDVILEYDKIVNDLEEEYFKMHIKELLEEIDYKINNVVIETSKTKKFTEQKTELEKYDYSNNEIINFSKNNITKIVYYVNYGSSEIINLDNLYTKINPSFNVPYIKYKNNRQINYKIHKPSIYTKIKNKKIKKKEHFKLPVKYIEKYDPNYFYSNINKKMLDEWKMNWNTLREGQFLKNEADKDSIYVENMKSYINIQFKINDILSGISKYCTINVNNNGCLEIKGKFKEGDNISLKYLESHIFHNTESKNNRVKGKSQKSQFKKIIYNIQKYTPNFKISLDKTNVKTMSIDSYSEIYLPKKIKISNIKKKINGLYPYIYQVENEKSDTIELKYIKTNKLESSESIRNYFIRLKSILSVDVSSFSDFWHEQTKKLFNLSKLESQLKLTEFSETIVVEDLNIGRLPPEYEVDIEIKNTKTINAYDRVLYKIKIKNCPNENELKNIYKFLKIFLFLVYKDDPKPQADPTPKKTIIIAPKFKKQNQFKRATDFSSMLESDDEDSNDNSNNNNNNNNNDNSNNDNENKNINLDEEDLPEDIVISADESDSELQPQTTFRTYFKKLRMRDAELFWFPTKTEIGITSYSRKCGAVDQRQPIVLSLEELDNFKRLNPEGYELMEPQISKKGIHNIKVNVLKWGSDNKKINAYICPKIWCVNCKLALTPDQLFENVSTKNPKYRDNEGKCPFCNGEISENQIIEGNKTIIIRRASSANNYWADKKLRKSVVEPSKLKLWEKYLYDTEKDAFSSFIEPSKHPKNMCMPCCNSTPLSKYNLCMTHKVTVATKRKINITKDLKPGLIIDNITLKEGDTILVKNQGINFNKENNIYIITKTGSKILEQFTDLNLDLQSGMVIEVVNGQKHPLGWKDTKWNIYMNNKNEVKVEFRDDSKEDKYVLGIDKFPLGLDKYGQLPENIDKLLYNNSSIYIKSGKPVIDSSLFLRRGIDQDINNSFISCFASILGIDLDYMINLLLTNITPDLFLRIKNGNLINQFGTNNKLKLDDIIGFINWCEEYSDFVSKLDKKQIIKSFCDNHFREKSKMKKSKKEKSNIEQYEANTEKNLNVIHDMIKNDTNVSRIFKIFISFESFKKYCGNYNIKKNYNFFWQLFSQKLDWPVQEGSVVQKIFKTGINIIILEREIIGDLDEISVLCPDANDIYNYIDFTKPVCFMLKQSGLFEPITYCQIRQNKIIPHTALSLSTIIVQNIQHDIIVSLLNEMIKQCNSRLDSEIIKYYNDIDFMDLMSLNDLKKIIDKFEDEFQIKSQLLDVFNRGIGVQLNNNVIIHTRPFGFNIEENFINIENMPLMDLDEMLRKLRQLDRKNESLNLIPTKLIEDNGNLVGILIKSGNMIPTKQRKKGSHSLTVIQKKYSKNIDKHLMLNINDERSNEITEYKINRNIYDNLRKEISSFLNKKNKTIKRIVIYIKSVVYNPVLLIKKKREILLPIINTIIKFLSVESKKPININNIYNNELCQKISNKCKGKCTNGSNQTTIDIEGESIIIRGSKCKLLINKNSKHHKISNHVRYVHLITEEIIRYPLKRNELLGASVINKEISFNESDDILFLNDATFEPVLDNMFHKNENIYLLEKDTYETKNYIEFDNETISIDKLNTSAPIQKMKKPLSVKRKKLVLNDTSNTKIPLIMATLVAEDGTDYTGKEGYKEGKCLFPWSVYKAGQSYNNLYACFPSLKNKKLGSYCATELVKSGPHKNRALKTGWCPKGSITKIVKQEKTTFLKLPKKSSIKTTSSPIDGKDFKHKPGILVDNCILPFKNGSKWENECVPSRNPSWRKWCATSLKKTGKAKDRTETYAYCLESEDTPENPANTVNSPLEINQDPDIISPEDKDIMAGVVDKNGKSYNSKDIMEGKCIFPFKYKRKNHNDCIDTGYGPWCATEVNKHGTLSKYGYCIGSGKGKSKKKKKVVVPSIYPQKEIYTTNFDKYGTHHSGSDIKIGKCQFPFKYKRREHDECIDTGAGYWCATEVKPTGTFSKYAYCLPEGQRENLRTKKKKKGKLILKGSKGANKGKKNSKGEQSQSLDSSNNSNLPTKKVKYTYEEDDWLLRHFGDPSYKIIKTLSQGDCFFDAIRLAFPPLTVKDLRTIVRDNFTYNKYTHYNTIERMLREALKEKKWSSEIEEMNTKILYGDFKFIKGKTYTETLDYIMDSNFWADSFSIDVIEKTLNIKTIILAEETLRSELGIQNLVQCGDMPISLSQPCCIHCNMLKSQRDEIAITEGEEVARKCEYNPQGTSLGAESTKKDIGEHFWTNKTEEIEINPEKYVILSYSGTHYRLIEYNGKTSFDNWEDIPEEITELIETECIDGRTKWSKVKK